MCYFTYDGRIFFLSSHYWFCMNTWNPTYSVTIPVTIWHFDTLFTNFDTLFTRVVYASVALYYNLLLGPLFTHKLLPQDYSKMQLAHYTKNCEFSHLGTWWSPLASSHERYNHAPCLPSPLPLFSTQVGLYKMHPDIPEQLSEKAHSFILRCFEPDPNKRATAAHLLEDPFLTEYDT